MLKKIIIIILLLLLSFIFSLYFSYQAEKFPSKFLNVPIQMTLTINNILSVTPQGNTYLAKMQRVCLPSECLAIERQFILSDYRRTPKKLLKFGGTYRITAKLKRLHGYHDEGVYNTDLQGFIHKINFAAYITRDASVELIKPASMSTVFYRLKNHLFNKILDNLQENPDSAGIVEALILGNKSFISSTVKQRLAVTGTSYLFVISGIHIALIVNIVSLMFRWLWRRSARLCLWLPAQKMGQLVGVLFACFYVVISGLEIPSLRALGAVIFITIFMLKHQEIFSSKAFFFVCIMAILFDPYIFLEISFCLSYGAVFLIYYVISHRKKISTMMMHLKIQLAMMIGLAPFLCAAFQEIARMNFFANIMAIPLVMFLILPLSFLASFMPVSAISAQLFVWDHQLIVFLLWILSLVEQIPQGVFYRGISHDAILISMIMACLFFLAPRVLNLQYLSVIFFLPFFVYQPIHLESGNFKVNILDVGQGLSIVLRTATHTLIYDLGPVFPNGHSATKAAVIPFLRSQGIYHIDTLMISHQDSDHVGDIGAFLAATNTDKILTSATRKLHQYAVKPCLAGQSWTWDGVVFSVLSPDEPSETGDNLASCVLKVTSGRTSLLLTGDIEKSVEFKLVASAENHLAANVLVLAHHGSRTSSTNTFIEAVHPQIGIISSGFENRYHFPSPLIVNRLKDQGIRLLNTSHCGEISLDFSPKNVGSVRCYTHDL